MGNKFSKIGSWKTTVAGVTQFAWVTVTALVYLFDKDPRTVADWGLVTASFLTMVAFFFARDNDKSSENVGAK